MKYLPYILSFLILSCSYNKLRKSLSAKGYDPNKDTAIIKPYEYYIKSKGYTIQYKELQPSKTLNIKIGIKGYKDSDTIPINVLKNGFELYISDSTIKNIVSGEVHYKFQHGANMAYLSNKHIDSLKGLSFGPTIQKLRKFTPTDFVFLWNFNVQKGDDIYAIPSKSYFIKY